MAQTIDPNRPRPDLTAAHTEPAAPPADGQAPAGKPVAAYTDNAWGRSAKSLGEASGRASARDYQAATLWALDQQNQAQANPADAQSRTNLAALEASLPATERAALSTFLANHQTNATSDLGVQSEAFLSNPSLPQFSTDAGGAAQAALLMHQAGAWGDELELSRSDLALATEGAQRMAATDPAGYKKFLAAIGPENADGARKLDAWVQAHRGEEPSEASRARLLAYWSNPYEAMSQDSQRRPSATSMGAAMRTGGQAPPVVTGWQVEASRNETQASPAAIAAATADVALLFAGGAAGQAIAGLARATSAGARAATPVLTPSLSRAANAVAAQAQAVGARPAVATEHGARAAETAGTGSNVSSEQGNNEPRRPA